MRQLRHGVQLKKVEHVGGHSVEYELTPYEILMEDIRSRRYTLNKVMVRFLFRNAFTFEERIFLEVGGGGDNEIQEESCDSEGNHLERNLN